MSEIVYFFIQLGGCLLQLIPVPILLYMPFSDQQLKASKRKIVALAVGIMAAESLLMAAVFTAFRQNPHILERGSLWIFAALFLLAWIVGTVLYVFSFQPGIQCRMLGYFVSMQYAVSSYTIAEITGKMGPKNAASPFSLTSLAAYGICLLVLFPIVWQFLKRYGYFRLRGENRWMLQLISVSSLVLFLLYAIALLAGLGLFRDTDDPSTNIYLGVWLICMLITDLAAYFIFFFCLHSEEEKETLHVKLTAYELQSQSHNDKIQEDKRTAHNMRHHFRLLVSLLEKKQYRDAEEYMKKYLNEWESHRSGWKYVRDCRCF